MTILDAIPAETSTTSAPATAQGTNDGDAFTGGGPTIKYRLAPTVSWARARVGTSFRYILLPAPEGAKGVAYDYVDQTELDNVTVKRYKNGDPKKQYELTLATDLENFDLLTDNAVTRKKEDGEDDDHARVLIIKWPNEKPFLDAVTASGAAKPEVGAYGTVTLAERRPNKGGQPSPIVSVTYNRPTDATVAKAEEVAAKRAKAREAARAARDAARAARENAPLARQAQEDEPPF